MTKAQQWLERAVQCAQALELGVQDLDLPVVERELDRLLEALERLRELM